MKHFEVTYFNGISLVHFEGVGNGGDMSLCGCDLAGDSQLGYDQAIETTKPVNCVVCQNIIKAAKKVKPNELANID